MALIVVLRKLSRDTSNFCDVVCRRVFEISLLYINRDAALIVRKNSSHCHKQGCSYFGAGAGRKSDVVKKNAVIIKKIK